MSVQRLLVSAAVALLTLGGCGGAVTQDDGRAATGAAPSSRPANAGTIVVGQSGETPARTLWYMRIENLRAEPLAEQGFPNRKIAFTRAFAPGEYRVISWYRSCKSTCPTEGEQGLSPLRQVCGAPVTVVAGQRVVATVNVGVDSCGVEVA